MSLMRDRQDCREEATSFSRCDHAWLAGKGLGTPGSRTVAELESEILQLRKALNEARLERDILKKATVDSIGQRNSYVKTWGCGGFLNETNIYSRGKSLCF